MTSNTPTTNAFTIVLDFIVQVNQTNREYLVLAETFKKELCQGFDFKTAIKALVQAGWLEPGKDGKSSQKPRIAGLGTPRCYVFSSRIWEEEE